MATPQQPTRGEDDLDDLDEDGLLALAVAEQHAARREKAASGSVAASGEEDIHVGEDGLAAFEIFDKAEGGEPL